jgi:hypothetical protein
LIDRELLERNIRSFMYKHPARMTNAKHTFTMLGVILAILAAPFASAMMAVDSGGSVGGSNDAGMQAQLFPRPVAGYIYDAVGVPVNGASVTVKMINLVGTVTETQTQTTASDGFYSVSFAQANWDINYTIRIEATKNAQTGINETACLSVDDMPIQWLDATLGTIIPELSSYAPVVVSGFMMVSLAVIASRRRESGQ